MVEKKPSLDFSATRPTRSRARTSVYVGLVEEFIKSGKPEALITGVSTKLSSQYMGLRNAVQSLGLGEKVSVTRYSKEEEVWLIREDM